MHRHAALALLVALAAAAHAQVEFELLFSPVSSASIGGCFDRADPVGNDTLAYAQGRQCRIDFPGASGTSTVDNEFFVTGGRENVTAISLRSTTRGNVLRGQGGATVELTSSASVNATITVRETVGFTATGNIATTITAGGTPVCNRSRSQATLVFRSSQADQGGFGSAINVCEGEAPEARNFESSGVIAPGTYSLIVFADVIARHFGGSTVAPSSAEGEATVTFDIEFFPARGACCNRFGQCSEVSESACGEAGGNFAGFDRTCAQTQCPPPSGACCTSDGGCQIRTEADCGALGGGYLGDGVDCQKTECPDLRGACCLGASPNKTCEFLTREECQARSGVFRGQGVDCGDAGCECDVTWTGEANDGGAFDNPDNWQGGGVPRDRDVGCQNAVFNRPARVAFSSVNLNGLLTRGAGTEVTLLGSDLDLSGRTSAEFGSRPALSIGGGTLLDLEQGLFSARAAVVGDTAGSLATLRIDTGNATLTAQETIVGRAAPGLLSLDGGRLVGQELDIGTAAASAANSGVVDIKREGGATVATVRVGGVGTGTLTIENATLACDDFRAATSPAQGNGFNAGVTLSPGATLNARDRLSVGEAGRARMAIAADATATTGNTLFGVEAGSLGELALQGILNAGETVVGARGDGQAVIEGGGVLQVSGNLLIAETGIGVLRASGVELGSDDPSLIDVRNELLVGNRNTGVATITLGARAKAGKLTLGGFAGGEGLVTVDNASLEILGDTVIGAGGSGTLDVRGLAVALLNGPTDLARDANGTASISIARGGSATATPTVDFRDTLRVGVAGRGELRVEAGGLARVLQSLRVGGLLESADGRVELQGAADPASLEVTDDIFLGEFLGDGELTLFGRTFVKANRIVLGRSGSFTTRPGAVVQANVVNDGQLEIGATPGKQPGDPPVIQGNLEMLPNGVLRVAVTGGAAALTVTGDAALAGRVELIFEEGVEPVQDAALALLAIEGVATGTFGNVVAPGRDGFDAALTLTDGVLRATVTSPGTPIDTEGEGAEEGEGEGETPPPAGGGCGGCAGCGGGAKDTLWKHLGDWLLAALAGTVLLHAHRRAARDSGARAG